MGKTKEEKLLDAAESGDVAACRAALDSGADKNCKNLVRVCVRVCVRVRWLASALRAAPHLARRTLIAEACAR
jgi:hypothetical protein